MPAETAKYLRPEYLAEVDRLDLRARLVMEGFLSGHHSSPFHGRSVEFAQHREYAPGDDLRRLDWRVFARSDRYFIKQYESETNLRAHVILDCSASMRYPEQATKRRLNKFEYAATLAATLAYLLVQQHDAAGLVLFDDTIRATLEPSSNRVQLNSMVACIEQARLERPTGASGLFNAISRGLGRRGLVFLISDLLIDREELLTSLRVLGQGGNEVVVMHVLDADERAFDLQGSVRFEGLEDATQSLSIDPQSLRTGYLDALNSFIDAVRSNCAANRIDYVGLSTTDPLNVALRQYLAARRRVIRA